MKKNVFITGGTTGIGLELARSYLKEGHRVAVCGRSLSKLPQEFSNEFPELKSYEVDVKDRDAVLTAIRDFGADGGVDILIANAGRSHDSKLRIPEFNSSLDVMKVNVLGVMHAFEGALEFMLKQKSGHLVGIASVAGFIGLPGAGAYCGSKAAVLRLCESYAIDLKPEGITVTAVCPGFVDTPLTQVNEHPMPFLMSAAEGAKRIRKALDKKKELFLFPKRMQAVIWLLDKMPRSLYRMLMRTVDAFNFSK